MGAGYGDDVVFGGKGHDTIYGGNSQDTLNGGRGNDTRDGGNGKDSSMKGDDHILLGAGREIAWGDNATIPSPGAADSTPSTEGEGDEALHGGRGDDHLWGGGGLFHFTVGNDVIHDRESGDAIGLPGKFKNFGQVQTAMTQDGDDVVITKGVHTLRIHDAGQPARRRRLHPLSRASAQPRRSAAFLP